MRREIAVLVSLGISKWNIWAQVLLEESLLYIVSFAIAGIVTKGILTEISQGLDTMQGSGIVPELPSGSMMMILGVGLSENTLLTGISIYPYMKKPVKEVLSEMED